MKGKFKSHFKREFYRGIAALLPTILTIVIIILIFKYVYLYVGKYIYYALLYTLHFFKVPYGGILLKSEGLLEVESVSYTPMDFGFFGDDIFWISLGFKILSFLVAIVAIYFVGLLLAGVGRKIWRKVEQFFSNLPIFKSVYPYVKQFTDYIFLEKRLDYDYVVAVEYPRKGIYSFGLVTGYGLRVLHEETGRNLVNVFIPSTPWPLTGYLIFVPSEDVIPIPLKVDDVMRLAISGGVLVPPDQVMGYIELARKRKEDKESVENPKTTEKTP